MGGDITAKRNKGEEGGGGSRLTKYEQEAGTGSEQGGAAWREGKKIGGLLLRSTLDFVLLTNVDHDLVGLVLVAAVTLGPA